MNAPTISPNPAFLPWWPRAAGLALSLLLVLALGACKTPPPPPPPPPSNEAVALDEAIVAATDTVAVQALAASSQVAKGVRRAVVFDPALEGGSGQQTALTRQLEEKVSARLRSNHPQLDLLPFEPAALNTSQYVMTGTVTREPGSTATAHAPFRIALAMTDLKTGTVVAQSTARARDDALDTTPTPYYRDSPVLVKDKVVDGYIATSETAVGQQADGVYFERLATAAQINEGTAAYNAGKFPEALEIYKAALATPSGEQLRTLNGIYLSSWKLGRNAEAEQAFGKVVALGLANNNLGVKFLFKPNGTEFWSDPKVNGPYPLWLRQIARQSAAAKVCMTVVGHTSHTGSEAYNDKLSEQRATVILQKLGAEAKELAPRTKASGVGFRENIIGTGADDASDALDRRVEFKLRPC